MQIVQQRTLATAAVVGLIGLSYYILSKKRRTQNNSIPKIVIQDLIGNTPLVYLPALSKALKSEIYIKAQFLNPFGSSKDRAVKQILKEAERAGFFDRPETRAVVQASSGSTAISLSQLSNTKGLTTYIYLPNDLAEEKYALLQLLNAKIVKVPPVSIVDPNHFYNLAQSRSKRDSLYFCNQFENLSNMKAHFETTGPEIYRQTNGLLDAFVCSAGTGGTLAGVSKYLKLKKPSVKILLADPQGSGLHNKVKYGILYSKEQKEGYRKKNPFDSITQGIGLNRSTKNFEQAAIDDSYKVTDEEALHLSRYLIINQGLFLGSSSAINLAATIKYCRQHPGSKVVTVSHDNGNSAAYLKDRGIQFVPKQQYPADDLSFIK